MHLQAIPNYITLQLLAYSDLSTLNRINESPFITFKSSSLTVGLKYPSKVSDTPVFSLRLLINKHFLLAMKLMFIYNAFKDRKC